MNFVVALELMVLKAAGILGTVLLTATGSFSQERQGPPSDIPVVTVCEALTDLQRYEGKTIVVLGRFTSTDEGSWLDAECGFKVQNAKWEFPTSISTSYAVDEFAPAPIKPSGFRWDEPLLRQKLEQLKQTTRLREVRSINYADQWVAFLGRLETQLPRKIRVSAERIGYTPGFGHLSAAPAQLIPAKNGFLVLK